MPIYEFLCEDCNRVFSFLARDPDAAGRQPACPQCGGRKMNKLFSRFAMSRGVVRPSEPAATEKSRSEPDLTPEQEARLERAVMGMASEMDSVDENDPRQMARMMRRLSEAAGQPIDPETNEMIRRLEAGEDPEKIEEKMADAFGDGAAAGEGGGAPSYDPGLYDL